MRDLLGLIASIHRATTQQAVTITAADIVSGEDTIVDHTTRTIYLNPDLDFEDYCDALGRALGELLPHPARTHGALAAVADHVPEPRPRHLRPV